MNCVVSDEIGALMSMTFVSVSCVGDVVIVVLWVVSVVRKPFVVTVEVFFDSWAVSVVITPFVVSAVTNVVN